jgi:glycosyltransferase involved in cell wall biosynthesis
VPGNGESEGYAVYIGRLSREKGIETLIEAMTQLPKESSLRLKILGQGPVREALEKKVRETCPDRVEFLGFLSGEELHETIRRAAFGVVPSEWYENFPFAVLEAFALGTPVVGARIGGIPEMVEPGVTGQLHESGDPESLRDALLCMTSPAADLKEMGTNARRRIEKDNSVDRHLERLIEIYRDVAKEVAN